MQDTIEYLNNTLKTNDTVIIGLSGGPDSMCLLNLLLDLDKNIKIIVAHINHNIRLESDQEAEFVQKYCKDKNIPYEYIKFPKKSSTKDFNEEELRKKRYDFFEQIVNKYHASYLLTAHHGDDLIETILMRITRGSNLKGYTGFNIQTPKNNYSILRPLIYTTKKEIEEFNKNHNIPFVIDKTNEEDKYTRNRYRHYILPFLKNENQDVHTKYLQFNEELNLYFDFVERIIDQELNTRYKDNILDITNYNELDILIQQKLIERIFSLHYPNNLNIVNKNHIKEILSIINNSKPNIETTLPGPLYITKEYNKLIIDNNKKTSTQYKIELKDDITLPNNHQIIKVNECDKKSNYYIRLNSNELKLPLYVRNRENGDRMAIKNMEHPKKIKDIFIDSKIPKSIRDTIPIVTDSENHILWIPGIKKSKFDKEKSENYDIILWYN